AAADALARHRNAHALSLLWTLYDTGDAQRRLLAVRCIGRSGLAGQEGNLLRIAIGDRCQAIRMAAADELARLETADAATARFLNAAADGKMIPVPFRFRALQAVARIRGKGAADGLRAWLTSLQTDMAVAAAEGLGRLDDLSEVGPLIAALATNDTEVKSAIADTLQRLTGERYRYDIVKWTQWQQEHAAQPQRPAKGTGAAPASADAHRPAQPVSQDLLDVVVVFDTTASMMKVWPQLRGAVDAVLAELVKQAPSLRLGTVKYRAPTPEQTLTYMVKAQPLTRNYDAVREDLKDAAFGGESGGLHLGLDYAVRTMAWRVEARKVIILVGDTSPPEPGVRACLQTIADAWQMDGILTNVIYVRSQHGEEQMATYCLLAKSTAGCFYEFNKAEKHLVELSAEKVDVRQAEDPRETAAKWCVPRP
ncbi:MAG: VWA domain-containing protein, partial [Planctomycetota bacterium]|nr:VWA domain-containing protein [Planctomycetota bacterium]